MPRKGYADVLRDPTKRVPQEEKIGRTTEKLGESDRRSLQAQIAQTEEDMRAKQDLNPQADVSDLRKSIDHKKMILGHDDDLTPKSGNQRDRLAARAKELESLLVPKMCTKHQMWPASNDPKKMSYVKQNGDWQDTFGPEINEWRDIQRKLNPDDPNAHSLELIRPD